ncbi:3',5'-cyclic AMP phosphodiesterase CpdA [Panacagrimonas perspica]|uniref:3',5'-cyclic AMP phosphodiesterase CpdA n=2 Tax=Panacagrimonas perspica TaxID=381431 RepID=A0A4R7P5B9_9GAMM|nr:3',5'-cyclic AMP phosphodiesterase CpdA [Panacagrimonas perspica]
MIETLRRQRGLSMNPVTLAHVSDLHLPFEPQLSLAQRFSKRQLSAWSWRRRRHLQRPEILDALAADLRTHAPDHIVVTGDITNFSLPGEFRQAAEWLSALAPAGQLSLVPGNHDALVGVAAGEGLGRWAEWTRLDETQWPFVHRVGEGIALIGLNSALPTAPLLAQGRLGSGQLARLERILFDEGAAGRIRIVLLHHPVAAGAVSWRKALSDAPALRELLRCAGAELVLHGHARDARLDALDGPNGPIPCLCVPSSSALPNPRDEGARWHRVVLGAEPDRAQVLVRRWSVEQGAFVDAIRYDLQLPRRHP